MKANYIRRGSLADKLGARSQQMPSGCIEWIGCFNNSGYGTMRTGGKSWLAHRLAYIARFGEIPAGLDIDHLCRNRACVNAEHMEPVTRAENTRRGNAPPVVAKRNGTCYRGHPMSGENLYVAPNGLRVCRICQRSAVARYKQRRKAA